MGCFTQANNSRVQVTVAVHFTWPHATRQQVPCIQTMCPSLSVVGRAALAVAKGFTRKIDVIKVMQNEEDIYALVCAVRVSVSVLEKWVVF